MHDLLFLDQDQLTRDHLIAKAAKLKLDVYRFIRDLDSHRFKARVEADRQKRQSPRSRCNRFLFHQRPYHQQRS